ncbi:MAG: LamG domain-containing protein [Pseudomonadota bacterium]
MTRHLRNALGALLPLLTLAACSDPSTANGGAAGQAGAMAGASGSSAGGVGGTSSSAGSANVTAGSGGTAAGAGGSISGGGASAGSASGGGGAGGASGGASGATGGGGASGASTGGGGGSTACPGAGHAVEFDGDAHTQMDSESTIDTLPKGNTSRTVEMWVYAVPKSWRAEHHLYQFGGTNPREGAFGIDFGDGPYPNTQVYTNGTADTTFKVPQDTVKETGWFHYAMVWDAPSKTLKGVINGVTAGQKVISAMLTTSASKLSIGYSPTFSSNGGFTGKIDEFRIWNVARTDAEITATMKQRLTGKETGLVVYYTFDEGTGTSSTDLVGNYVAKFGGTTQPKWVTSDLQLTCP